MKIVRKADELREALEGLSGARGFVPTMGALHAGHEHLMAESRARDGHLVASIFVNPKQFGPSEDWSRYPRPFEADAARCERVGVDVLFAPEVETVYPPDFSTAIRVQAPWVDRWCGASRPGHFDGVTTVLTRLFGLVRPDRAYFGQKDFQQWRVVSRLAADLAGPEIIRVPTVREPDGLALSSRNIYLSPGDRLTARALSRSLARLLTAAREALPVNEILAAERARLLATPGLTLEYLEVVGVDDLAPVASFGADQVALVAARVGAARLIDNALMDPTGPDFGLLAYLEETDS